MINIEDVLKNPLLYRNRLTLEDYLIRDVDGKSLLSLLCTKCPACININIVKKNPDLLYEYLKANSKLEGLYEINLNEDDYFKIYDGKKLVDHLFEKIPERLLIINWGCFTKRVEILDYLVKKDLFILLASRLSFYLYDHIFDKIDGISFFEKNINNEKIIKMLVPRVKKENFKEFVSLIQKYNKNEYLIYLNEDILKLRNTAGNLILKILLDLGIYPDKVKYLNIDTTLIPALVELQRFDILKNVIEELLVKNVNGKMLIEILYENDVFPSTLKENVSTYKVIKFLCDNDKLDNVKFFPDVLMEYTSKIGITDALDNQILMEYLINKGYDIKEHVSTSMAAGTDVLNYLYNTQNMEVLFKIGALTPNKKVKDEITNEEKYLIEVLLKNNPDAKVEYQSFDKNCIELFLKYERYDLLLMINIMYLQEYKMSDKYSCLDFVLDKVKEGKVKYNLSQLNSSLSGNVAKANFYLKLARKKMLVYYEIKPKDLISGNPSVLELMLEKDTNTTIDLIEEIPILKEDIRILAILKKYDQDVKFKIKFPANELEKDVAKSNIITNVQGPILKEEELLLEEIRKLFLNEKNSKIVENLIDGYRIGLFVNKEYTINEMKKLIEVKKNNLFKFNYLPSNSGSFFSRDDSVYIEDNDKIILLHETGHALHYFVEDYSTPEEYEQMIDDLCNDPLFLNRVISFLDEIKELYAQVQKENEYNVKVNYEVDKTEEEIITFFNKTKEEQKKELVGLTNINIDPGLIDEVLDSSYTIKDYKEQRYSRYERRMLDVLIRDKYNYVVTIQDIIDAIYRGKYSNNKLEGIDFDMLDHTYGHGIAYYSNINHNFSEVIANFAALSKMLKAKENMEKLRMLIGDELYYLIQNYYEKMIGVKEKEISSISR